MNNTLLISIEFCKNEKEVDVFISNDNIKEIFRKNDSKLAEFIDNIKKKIPDKKSKKKVKINVFLLIDKDNNPSVRTKVNYSFGLGKHIASITSVLIDELNLYFTKVIMVALQTLDAKNLESVDSTI